MDWDNDGVFDDLHITGEITHDFGTPGVYIIRIRGIFPRFYFYNDENPSDAKKYSPLTNGATFNSEVFGYPFTDVKICIFMQPAHRIYPW